LAESGAGKGLGKGILGKGLREQHALPTSKGLGLSPAGFWVIYKTRVFTYFLKTASPGTFTRSGSELSNQEF